MRVSTVVLTVSVCLSSAVWLEGASVEELVFVESPYVEAAKAVSQGDVDTLTELIGKGLDVNHQGQETRTPWGKDTVSLLLWATLTENLEAVAALVAAGADPNKATRKGMAPLIVASRLKSQALFELLLVRYKADPNRIVRRGRPKTALMVTLKERRNLGDARFERAELLLKHGAKINLDMGRGETAITAFAKLEDWRAVLWLLMHGADHELRDKVGATAVSYLRNSYRADTLAPSEAYTYRDNVRDWLLAHGVARESIYPRQDPKSRDDE